MSEVREEVARLQGIPPAMSRVLDQELELKESTLKKEKSWPFPLKGWPFSRRAGRGGESERKGATRWEGIIRKELPPAE